MNALSLVYQNTHDRAEANEPVNGKVVVNMSFGVELDPTNADQLYWIQILEQALQALLALDAALVTAAGNSRVSTLIHHTLPTFKESRLTSTGSARWFRQCQPISRPHRGQTFRHHRRQLN